VLESPPTDREKHMHYGDFIRQQT